MPVFDIKIRKIWKDATLPNYIHYIIDRPDGSDRRLFAKPGTALYVTLQSHLDSVNYIGPKS